MRYPVSVVIPTRNEENTVESAVASARAAGAAEVIVSDGGSTDGTIERARRAGAAVLSAETIRGRQLNRAAEQSRGAILLFLHADTLLPSDALPAVVSAVERGYIFGGFRVRFIERSFRLRLAAKLINLRTALTRCPWGDQGQFVVRDVFFRSGGFRDYPLMEDYELAIRMKRLGRTILLPQWVRTSGRRFLEKGLIRTAIIDWRIVIAYRLGADPYELEKLYRAA